MTEKINWDEVTLEPMNTDPVNPTETGEETSEQMENVASQESGEPVVDTTEADAEQARFAEETAAAEQSEVEKLTAELHGLMDGKVEGVESQKQLASDYLAAYGEFRKIADKRNNDLRILDKLREEAIAPNLIEEQEELFASSQQEYEEAMSKYSKIGEKLTDETKEKYLK